MSPFRAVVDYTNKSVTVVGPTGRAECAVGPGVTTKNAAAALARHGWAIDGNWRLSSPPDGFECGARPAERRST